ncbi:GDSL esterase/lipase [Zostera marina]|uniref:GDSL esterase/lipase n=1 Tax=Zostera marina TaxID=29655 RepID=A0A0K9NYR4_ZOSMR|nr:GDSL esterase/lipase [Zostera marina]
MVDAQMARRVNVPALYMFGDSTADAGNNNQLSENGVLKVNFAPYGIDYPDEIATGRFCNGKIEIDYIAMMIGFKGSPPPYLSTINNPLKQAKGVNFASGGSGILDTTGQNTSISLNAQLMDFKRTKEILIKAKGKVRAKRFLAKSIILFSIATNDLFAFVQKFGFQNTTQNGIFVSSLATQFKSQIKRIYQLGGRKFVVFGVGRLGCLPASRVVNANYSCSKDLNDLSKLFNIVLKMELHHLSSRCRRMSVSYIDSYGINEVIASSPLKYGFTELKAACCGSGVLNAQGFCLPNSTFCENRNQYISWDLIHSTQALNEVSANLSFYGSPTFAYPINIQELVSM